MDGAYGGVAAVVPEMRGTCSTACERADSLVVNPHKWLFTPIDCSAFYTRRPDVLQARVLARARVPGDDASGDEVVNLMDYGVQLGRRFRALKLWMVIRAFGAEGLAARIARALRAGAEFAGVGRRRARLGASCAPVPFSLVVLPLRAAGCATSDGARRARTERSCDGVNAERRGVPVAHEAATAATCCGSRSATSARSERHVERAWELLRAEALRLGALPVTVAGP